MNINHLRKGITFLGCLVLTMTVGVSAQQDEKATPLVQVPYDKMTWKITLVESSSSSNPNGVESLTVSKKGDVSKVILKKKDGASVQYLRVGNCTLFYIKSRNKIFPVSDNSQTPPYPFASSGFYGIEHVSPTDEQKTAVFEQTQCRYFHGANYEAWFDSKTGLPKAYRASGLTFVFQFATVPEEFQLPPEYQAAADQHRANMIKAGLLP